MVDMFTEDRKDEDKVYARIKLNYTKAELDDEARATTEQELVSDKYFYIPLTEDYDHHAFEYVEGFLAFVNE